MQKFEDECEIQMRPMNRAFEHFPMDTSTGSHARLDAWQTGQTGYPLIDAAMRCVNETGYLNFRMRAMLVVPKLKVKYIFKNRSYDSISSSEAEDFSCS